MSPNERWRRFNIINNISPDSSEELVGGLKNALERRQSLQDAKRSFINAGYSPQDVERAAKHLSQLVSSISPKVNESQGSASQKISKVESPKVEINEGKTTSQTRKKLSIKVIIILSIISALVMISSALVIIFWDKIA